jgi:hypothetical protein
MLHIMLAVVLNFFDIFAIDGGRPRHVWAFPLPPTSKRWHLHQCPGTSSENLNLHRDSRAGANMTGRFTNYRSTTLYFILPNPTRKWTEVDLAFHHMLGFLIDQYQPQTRLVGWLCTDQLTDHAALLSSFDHLPHV